MLNNVSFESILESSKLYRGLYTKTTKKILEILESEDDLRESEIKSILREFAIKILDKLKQFNIGIGNSHSKKSLANLMNKQLDFLRDKKYIDIKIRGIIDEISPNEEKINTELFCPLYNFAIMTSSAVAMIIKWKDIDSNNASENRRVIKK